jgi:hypothetical protein
LIQSLFGQFILYLIAHGASTKELLQRIACHSLSKFTMKEGFVYKGTMVSLICAHKMTPCVTLVKHNNTTILSSSLALPSISLSFALHLVIAAERMSLSVAAAHVNSFASSDKKGSGSCVRAHLSTNFEVQKRDEHGDAIDII